MAEPATFDQGTAYGLAALTHDSTLRRFLREQLRRVAAGEDPAGVARGPAADAMQRFAECGNFIAA
jgi:hypothetical protein